MTTLIRATLVCLCGLVSALAVADSTGVATDRSDVGWLWSTGDFKTDRSWTDQDISGEGNADATNHVT
jgi:hypothetical protein